MDEKEVSPDKVGPRIRYAPDLEANDGRPGRLAFRRTESQDSTSSMSIRPVSRTRSLSRSRRLSVDPATALPITYRTISIEINETKERELAQAQATKQKAKNQAADEFDAIDWHRISLAELYGRLRTAPAQGLSTEQAQRRLIEYGRNVPSKPKSRLFQKILGYFFVGFGPILLTASILVFVSYKPLGQPPQTANLALAIVLLVVFFIQAAFNAWQDFSSSRVMASITTMLPDHSLVLRDGVQTELVATELVPGDVLLIKAGNKLPADVRFFEISSDAKFDRAILTGESLPISGTIDSTDDNYLETHCIGLQGTHCTIGSGLGVVVATGDKTVFGRIAQLTNKPKTGATPLQKEIFRFVVLIVSIALTMILIVIIIWAAFIRRKHPNYISVPTLIVDCVSVAVAFVPEGLPIALTASLTITANIMRKNKILCKSLKTVETLGAVSVICSDKTGTLTKNQMFVTDCTIGSKKWTDTSARDELSLDSAVNEDQKEVHSLNQFRCLAALCNAGEFDASTMSRPLLERRINGDATDQAVLYFSESLGSVAEVRRPWTKVFDLPFNSKNKFMIRIFSTFGSSGLNMALPSAAATTFNEFDMLLTIKGAPDILIDRCNLYTDEQGVTRPLDTSMRDIILNDKDQMSANGKRVILLARKILPSTIIKAPRGTTEFEREAVEQAKTGLTLVGLVGIVDPPRDEIPEVIQTLRGAGIKIFMVTGDFKLTAQAIAKECGIITSSFDEIDDITALSRDEYTIKKGAKSYYPDTKSKTRKNGKPVHDSDTGKPPDEDVTQHHSSIVLSGSELITLNDTQWSQLCTYDEIVFARTTPEQKLRIVKEFQARENIVGMTGDGVNDAPSLKAADIGIALGSGSDIAIEAADMVLLESFSAVVEALKYGRVVNDNLKKTVIYLLPAGSFSEFWPIFSSVIFGLPQILSSFLMIIICCFTDCAAATTIAYEKPEADVLLRPPRNPRKDRLVDWRLLFHAFGIYGVFECVASFAMAYWYAQRKGVPFSILWLGFGNLPEGYDQTTVTGVLNEASSIYFVNLVVMQWFLLLAIRTRRLSLFQQPPLTISSLKSLKRFFPLSILHKTRSTSTPNPSTIEAQQPEEQEAGRAGCTTDQKRETTNLALFPAILFSLIIVFIFCYIPALQRVINSTQVPVAHFFLPMAFGMAVLLFDEGRKYVVRRNPRGFVGRVAW